MANIKSITESIRNRVMRYWNYCAYGVWSDMRPSLSVRLIKTLNLSVRAFFNGDIQTKACAMTYRTFLSLVPALALIFAIGKGFGLQQLLEDEIVKAFPSQTELLNKAFRFVDSYLNQSSEGVFVGVGIALLLWTLISILGSVEKAFNDIWGVKNGRSFWRKLTDYLAIFLILPVLMICGSGLTVFVSTAAEHVLPSEYVSPMMSLMLDFASLLLIWFFFTGVYIMIPTTKVKFRNAFGAGVFAGTAFIILQWLFISGQVYVSKYNAIYGSFAFLPLFLIWVQFAWVICLSGGVICYASQNIFRYNFSTEISKISPEYKLKFTIAVIAIVTDNYLERRRTPTEAELANEYELPARLLASTTEHLVQAGLLLRVVVNPKSEVYGYAPAVDPALLTVGDVIRRLRSSGTSDFIPDFDVRFTDLVAVVDRSERAMYDIATSTLVKDLKIKTVKQTI